FAVTGRGAGGVAVLAVVAGPVGRLGQLRLEVLGPANGPGLAVEADQVPHQVLLVAGGARRLAVAAVAGEVNRVADGYRAGGARPRELGLPDDVVLLGPLLGEPRVAAHALAARPAELHPVHGRHGGDDDKANEEGQAAASDHGWEPLWRES